MPRIPRALLIDSVWCEICHQRPWKAVAYDSVASFSLVLSAWCHGAFRRWLVGNEVMKAAAWRDDFGILVRALTAFAAMPIALPPVLVAIRRLRGRRLPLLARDRLIVWCMP